MDRLTERLSDGCIRIKGCKTVYSGTERKRSHMTSAVVRLAAYEDTGLTPQEINRIIDAYGRGMTLRTDTAERLKIIREIPTERLREIAAAEKALKKREDCRK